VSYRLVDELQTKAVPVAQTCRLLGVSRAGFYEAKRRSDTPTFCKTSVHLRAAFMSSGQSYGSRRLVVALANGGLQVGRFKVRRLMQQASLKPIWKRKFVHTTDSRHALPVALNVLARQFNPAAPNLAYASDITYIRTGAGWLYLAVVLDLFSRRVVGWAMAPSMPATLVCDALRMAIQARRPAAGLIVHSDRGSQYASELRCTVNSRHSCFKLPAAVC
jgi:putative transposase